MKLVETLKRSWKTYKYRFVPWLKITRASDKMMTFVESKAISDEEALQQLLSIFKELYKFEGCNKNLLLEKVMGFQLLRQKSNIVNAGKGIFVSKGMVKKGQVVAIYPGTVYFPSDLIFFQSLKNQYIFSCSDNLLIDGKNNGISKLIYNSCSYRDKIGPFDTSDRSWHSNSLECPINVGQYVNNKTKYQDANVFYQEFNIMKDFPLELRKFVPNVNVNGLHSVNFLRTVVLIALQDIHEGEEVLSDYFTATQSS